MTNLKTTLFILLSLIMVRNSHSQNVLTDGDNYYLISMDDISASKISSKVIADFRPNEITDFFYIWVNSYTYQSPSTTNFFGENKAWISLEVGTQGWSGGGFYTSNSEAMNKLPQLMADTTDYRLHFAMKSTDNTVHLVGLSGVNTIDFAVGAQPFNDNGMSKSPLCDFPRDGQWHSMEIPLSKLIDRGLSYSKGMNAMNIFYILSGGITGTNMQIDAVFFYKKTNTNTALEQINENRLKYIDKTIHVFNQSSSLELYNLMGQKLKSTNESTMSIADIQAGIYIIRSGKNAMKIRL